MHCSSVNGFENSSYVLVVANVSKICGGGIIYSTHCGQNGKGTVSETKYSTPHCLATATANTAANNADDFADAVDDNDDADDDLDDFDNATPAANTADVFADDDGDGFDYYDVSKIKCSIPHYIATTTATTHSAPEEKLLVFNTSLSYTSY